MKFSFATLDVFTKTRFAGNPLAVVFEADKLDDVAMQPIAREFGYPETVFVVKPDAANSTARVRIFTPAMELTFAGHPTVGTALALALRRDAGRGSGGDITLEEKIGLLKCRVVCEGSDRGVASFALPALPAEGCAPAHRAAIAAALGLAEADIGFGDHQPSKWSLGNTFTFVPVRGMDAVRRCRIVEAHWDAAFESGGRSFAFVFCRETEHAMNDFHARMFAPRAGVPEDPATGSAAAAFAGFCGRFLSLGDGQHRFAIEQGFEMGRPSLIELKLVMRGGVLTAASVGGPAIIVTEGSIDV